MSKRIDVLPGSVFNSWTVIERGSNNKFGHINYICKCQCGQISHISSHALRTGKTTKCRQCNGSAFVDMTGKTVGDWTIISRAPIDSSSGVVTWTCKCSCGSFGNIRGTDLRHGKSTKCSSCQFRGKRSPKGRVGLKKYIKSIKHGAKQRNIDFSLPDTEIIDIISQNCYWCGKEPSHISKIKGKDVKEAYTEWSAFIHNGIDRRDNDRGYETGNCVPCCRQCNVAKLNYTEKEFLDHIKRIYEYQNFNKNNINSNF